MKSPNSLLQFFVFCLFVSLFPGLPIYEPAHAQISQTVMISPGDDIQALVTQHDRGTTFLLTKGIYRRQSITPKANNAFIGQPGAILSGAQLVTNFTKQNQNWVAQDQRQQGPRFGTCEMNRVIPPATTCMFPEDLFLDDVLLTQVTTLSEVSPGKWYFDYKADEIIMADDPSGRKVEASITPRAFQGSAPNVLIQGLIIEKYASPAQEAAIHGQTGRAGLRSRNWIVQENEVRWNHAMGIRLGEEMHIRKNFIHHNGQFGIGGSGKNILIEENEISFNNNQGFHWHTAGGTKFVGTVNLLVRHNFVHDNFGPGLWSDVDNLNTLYENNHVKNNQTQGIFHEASYDAIIRNNLVEGNGFGDSIWHVGSGILVSSSPNVEIYNNQVINNADGIGLIQVHTRVEGRFGPRELKNSSVHDNIIAMTEGQTGIGVTNLDPKYVQERNNRFENNTYLILGTYQGVFKRLSVNHTIERWRNLGQDTTSRFIRFPSPPTSETDWIPPVIKTIPAPTSLPRITVTPGTSIQDLINQHPAGTVFLLKSGIHRLMQIQPKNGNSFIGEPGTILSGAKLLSEFTKEGPHWIALQQTQQGPLFGTCDKELNQTLNESCRHPEDLFVNNVLLKQVLSLEEVQTGTWYFDYDQDRIVMADDPSGKKVETSVTRHAFEGSAQNVFISGLIIEKYANPAQEGAIHSRVGHAGVLGHGWIIQENEIRLNHGIGIRVGNESKVIRNIIHHNGQLGVGGSGKDILLAGNEIAHNNTQGFSWHWEAGGTRFVWTKNLVIQGNDIHHNTGPGIYTTPNNSSVSIEANRIAINEGAGIRHSASYDAIIKDNIVEGNGFGESKKKNGAGVLVTDSPNVEIIGNTITRNAYGIVAVQSNQADGPFGPRDIQNLFVHENTITMLEGKTGLLVESEDLSFFTSHNNRFSDNNYILFEKNQDPPFHWLNQVMSVSEWQDEQQEQNETVVIIP